MSAPQRQVDEHQKEREEAGHHDTEQKPQRDDHGPPDQERAFDVREIRRTGMNAKLRGQVALLGPLGGRSVESTTG